MRRYADVGERIKACVEVDDNGCWNWQRCIGTAGYGLMDISLPGLGNYRTQLSHRVSYTYFVGLIPEGLQIDHLCRNKACCNPEHLEAVTPQENQLRSESASGLNAIKTHCNNGHEFTESNTYHPPARPGHRHCRTCQQLRSAAHFQKRKAVA